MVAKTVATPTDAVLAMRKQMQLCATLMGGTDAMREASTKYLPQYPKEDAESYKSRLAVSTLFPAYQRTANTLASKPFSRPIGREGTVSEELSAVYDNVDTAGQNVDTFSGDLLQTTIAMGFCGVLVDFPIRDEIPNTLAAEKEAGLRPYWIKIDPMMLLGWRSQKVNGVMTLTQLRFMECVEEPDGEFDTVSIEQVRVLEPGSWRTYREVKDTDGKSKWQLHDSGTTSLDVIPFVPFYGVQVAFMVSKPPLLELAHLNVKHWQSQSDQDNILHVARVPILAITGDDEKTPELAIGAFVGLKLPIGGDAKFVEHTGKAIEAGAKSLETLKDEMRQSGAELLVMRQVQTTATEVSTDTSTSMSDLQRITLAAQDGLNQLVVFTQKWMNTTSDATLKLFTGFSFATIGDATAALVLDAETAGVISKETANSELKRRGVIDSANTWDDEKKLIDAQPKPEPTVVAPAKPGAPVGKEPAA